MLNEFTAHLYLFTHGPLPSSFCIILSACLLIFTLFPLLQLLQQFIILSAFRCCLLGVEHPPSANKHIALSSGPSLEDLPLLIFLHEGRMMLNKPRYDICYDCICRKRWCHTSFISPQFRNPWELLTSKKLL